MRADIEALASTADMISVLADAASDHIYLLHATLSDEQNTIASLGDWRATKAFLALILSQCDLVKSTVERFELFNIEKAA